MRVWDIRTAIAELRAQGFRQALELSAEGAMAGNALYASLFEDGITRLDLSSLAASHNTAPIYLNVLRHLDLPQAAAIATSRSSVRIMTQDKTPWSWTAQAAAKLGREKALEIVDAPEVKRTPRDWLE
jgi:hypothetical protein